MILLLCSYAECRLNKPTRFTNLQVTQIHLMGGINYGNPEVTRGTQFQGLIQCSGMRTYKKNLFRYGGP
jgi:hypothetical protein